MNAIDRARDDVAAGRVWLARDRLAGRLCNVCDTETLTLLAEVHLAMQDLPAAGAMFYTLGQPDATEAIAAWEAKYPEVGERWRSLPRTIRVDDNEPVRRLRESAGLQRPDTRTPQARWKPLERTWEDRFLDAGCGLLIFLFVAVIVTGLVGFVHWVVAA